MSNPRLLRYARRSIFALGDNVEHRTAARYALSIYAPNAVYSFVPKNACSTMRYSLAVANGAIEGPEQFNWIHANNSTFVASLAELIKADYTFTILRDPYLRIASCYLDKMVDQTEVAWHFHKLTNYHAPPAMLTFREFVAGIETRLSVDEHWRPQLEFLVYENYDDYFCVEAFGDAIARLRERIGLEVLDARDLTKHGADQFQPLESDASFADTPAYQIAALKRGGLIPRPAQLYDASLIERVGWLYADDIEFYTAKTQRQCAFSADSVRSSPHEDELRGSGEQAENS